MIMSDDAFMFQEDDDLAKVKLITIGNDENNVIQETFADGAQNVEIVALSVESDNADDGILNILQGIDMVFIITKDSAVDLNLANTVAKCAKEIGVLTFGAITKHLQFGFNEWKKSKTAETEKFASSVDAIFAVTLKEVRYLVKSIVDTVATPGLIYLELQNMKSIFGGVGYALMGFGVASGENAYEDAIKTVLNSSPIKEELKTAGGFLVNCTGNEDSFPVLGINEVIVILNEAIHPDGNINFSATIDNSLMDDVCVTLIATRLGELKDVPIREQSVDYDLDDLDIPATFRNPESVKRFFTT